MRKHIADADGLVLVLHLLDQQIASFAIPPKRFE
jgi:hypothetical protein